MGHREKYQAGRKLKHRLLRILCLGVVALLGSSCAPKWNVPDLAAMYDRSAQYHDETRNPVIVIPGILGSRLRDSESGSVVWGAFMGDYAHPKTAEGARLIALPMQEGAALNHLRDSVYAVEVLDAIQIQWFSLPIEQKAYYQLLRTLGAGGYRDENLGFKAIDYGDDHFTCFQFPYDWRRDLVENARRLDAFIHEKREYVRAEMEQRFGVVDPDIKFDLIAHSMGGLVTRYYLRYGTAELPEDGIPPTPTWPGAAYVDRAIVIGTPNAGSIESLLLLVNGVRFAPILPKFEAALLGTLPAVYQLLPRTRHHRVIDAQTGAPLDVFDPDVWEKMEWGLASPKQDTMLSMLLPEAPTVAARRRIARDHLRKSLERAQRFTQTIDVPAVPPPGLELHLIAGDAEPTSAVATVEPQTGKLTVVTQAPGDGTVLRASALMDEREGSEWTPQVVSPIAWERVNFVFADHLGMTKDPVFMDNLLYMLLEEPRDRGRD